MLLIKRIVSIISKREFKFLIHGITKRVNSEIIAIGLKRDLNHSFETPNALIELKIRLARESDHPHFSEENTNFGLVEKKINSCYVATDTNDHPCFRVWLMEASQNKKIKRFFSGNFPILKKDEALLEGAFALSTYRGNQIMPEAISRISQRGTDTGARYVLTFVDIRHITSLRACSRSGYQPYLLRREKWFLFKKKVSFMDIPSELMEKYNSATSK